MTLTAPQNLLRVQMQNQKLNTIIIGAGQGGLSVSYYLSKKGVEHLILERGSVAEDWRSHRWDNFHLLTPNFSTRLPGYKYDGKNPKGFDGRDQVVRFFKRYAKLIKAPVIENTLVKSVTKKGAHFLVETNKGDYSARNIVVAIGNFHKPKVPSFSKLVPQNILQLHSSEYKNYKQLPKGDILVVGTGNSGIQIAADLNKNSRTVYLAVGRHRILARRYRGKDFIEWAELLGILGRTAGEATPEIKTLPPVALFGKAETVNLRKLASEGVHLLGHLKEFKRDKFYFADDLEENLSKGEEALENFKKAIDEYILRNIIKAPKKDSAPKVIYTPAPLQELTSQSIKSIIWATGFQKDFSFLKVPVLDKDGEPVHRNGVSKVEGLYFMGLAWLSKYRSFFIFGADEDAKYITDRIDN
jgi:putative flavoprotein involved in K+ transport